MPTNSISSENISSLLKESLSPELFELLRRIGDFAKKQSIPIFLVGGPLRDVLLGQPLKDLDLMAEGDAVSFASRLVSQFKGQLLATSQFGTAKIKIDGSVIDLAAARKETYSSPGALPTVSPGTVSDDLIRRDFSINAIAASLLPSNLGKILDPYEGTKDLRAKRIRVLHDKSFQDDATRILRGIRYEQRLGFRFERNTKTLMLSSLSYLHTISGDRIRREFEHIFHEQKAPRMLDRARKLGVLKTISSGLQRTPHLESLVLKKNLSVGEGSLIFVAILGYSLSGREVKSFIKRLNMPTKWSRISEDASTIRLLDRQLRTLHLKPSQIYGFLHEIAPEALQAGELVTKSTLASRRIRFYLDELQFIKPRLDGSKLLEMGVPQGPLIGRILDELKSARLNEEVLTKQDEVQLAERLLKRFRNKYA